jgi:FAD/FMN-containing dehydrogenase
MTSLVDRLSDIVGPYVSIDADVLAARCVDWTGRYRGQAGALVRPGSPEEVGAVLKACRDAGVAVTVQGGRTSLVAGTVPEHRDVLLSTERLTGIGDLDAVERQIRVQAGVTLAAVQQVAAGAGLVFGVDLTARDSATIGGMASTNAGGLRTVRYGPMSAQVNGLEIVLPNGSVVQRHSHVRSDNTGYDLAALFVGAEGTLGVITAVDLRLHPQPAHRVTAVCGFADLDALVDAGRGLREIESIAALELIDGHAAALAAEHLGVAPPVPGRWLLLVELAGAEDTTDRLAAALDDAPLSGPAAVGADEPAQQRLWQLRESMAEVVGVFGSPVKFDVSLPLSEITPFTADASAVIARHAPRAIPLLFGHVGEGNLHLNVLRCDAGSEAKIYPAMMEVIATHGGNVSSEHGVGSLKRGYLTMSRQPADIAVMQTIKDALDPTGYLNPAVLFEARRP